MAFMKGGRLGIPGDDPLASMAKTGRELFLKFGKASSGFPFDTVIDASVNLLAGCMRQKYKTRKEALDEFDMWAAKARTHLAESYTSLGVRKNVYAYDQIIKMPHTNFRTGDIEES